MKNKKLYIILSLIIVVILAIFVFFIISYIKMDKNVYTIEENSVLYTNSLQYIKVQGKGRLEGKIDGNYYLYDTVGTEVSKYKIGKTAVVFRDGDPFVYIYGEAYQVTKTGEIEKLYGENKVSTSNPTKFFKLDDRKYLMVDSNITSKNNVINLSNYAYIELDKIGNATFVNNKESFKTINPLVINGSYFSFDIANEKLKYDKDTINLKNIIGSTNNYVKKTDSVITDSNGTESPSDDKNNSGNDGSNGSNGGSGSNKPIVEMDINYYDDYLNSIITSVNNLVVSLKNANDTTSKLISQKTVYYDFNKWVALKSVKSNSTTIEISYSVFDPNSEYDAVFIRVVDSKQNEKTYYLNKDNTSYTIRNLSPNSQYNLLFGYKTNSSNNEIIDDDVIVNTTKTNYSLTIDKISNKNIVGSDNKTISIYYTLKVDNNYKFKSARIFFMSDGEELYSNFLVNNTSSNQEGEVTGDLIGQDGIYKGEITLPANQSLGNENLLSLDTVEFCNSNDINQCSINSDFSLDYVFYAE